MVFLNDQKIMLESCILQNMCLVVYIELYFNFFFRNIIIDKSSYGIHDSTF
jgi:hypothetical protein